MLVQFEQYIKQYTNCPDDLDFPNFNIHFNGADDYLSTAATSEIIES